MRIPSFHMRAKNGHKQRGINWHKSYSSQSAKLGERAYKEAMCDCVFENCLIRSMRDHPVLISPGKIEGVLFVSMGWH